MIAKTHSKGFLWVASVALVLAFAVASIALVDPAHAAESQSSSAAASSTGATSVDSAEGNLVDPTQRADNSFIYDTTIESLIDESSLYDGRTVQVVGEAIGDLIKADMAGDECWVMLTSTDAENPTSISVLISGDQASQIDHFGRYGVTGTMFQVRGEYHQACSEHEGLPDIHVTNSAVITRGVENPDTFELDEYIPGVIAVLLGAALMGLYYIARERAR